MLPMFGRSPHLIPPSRYDPKFQHELERLHRLSVWGRWIVILLFWGVLGSLSVWRLRDEFHLMVAHFTWSSLRYALAFNPFAALGLVLCVGTTMSVLLWQSRNILLGLSDQDLQYLEKRLIRIRQQGKSHPLWKWICGRESAPIHCPTNDQHS